jgi:ERCC4-type nuclease
MSTATSMYQPGVGPEEQQLLDQLLSVEKQCYAETLEINDVDGLEDRAAADRIEKHVQQNFSRIRGLLRDLEQITEEQDT